MARRFTVDQTFLKKEKGRLNVGPSSPQDESVRRRTERAEKVEGGME